MTSWRGVRYRPDVGWEMRCDGCTLSKGAAYWPLDAEFWDTNKGLSRCRACWNAYERSRRGRGALRKRTARQREYQRQWSARKRAEQRADEGREKYQRRAA